VVGSCQGLGLRVDGVLGQKGRKGQGQTHSEAFLRKRCIFEDTCFTYTRISIFFVPFVPYSKVLVSQHPTSTPYQSQNLVGQKFGRLGQMGQLGQIWDKSLKTFVTLRPAFFLLIETHTSQPSNRSRFELLSTELLYNPLHVCKAIK